MKEEGGRGGVSGGGGGGRHWNGGGEGIVVASYAVVVGHAGANAEKAPCCTFSTSTLAYPQLLTALGKSAALKRRATHSSMSGLILRKFVFHVCVCDLL